MTVAVPLDRGLFTEADAAILAEIQRSERTTNVRETADLQHVICRAGASVDPAEYDLDEVLAAFRESESNVMARWRDVEERMWRDLSPDGRERLAGLVERIEPPNPSSRLNFPAIAASDPERFVPFFIRPLCERTPDELVPVPIRFVRRFGNRRDRHGRQYEQCAETFEHLIRRRRSDAGS